MGFMKYAQEISAADLSVGDSFRGRTVTRRPLLVDGLLEVPTDGKVYRIRHDIMVKVQRYRSDDSERFYNATDSLADLLDIPY